MKLWYQVHIASTYLYIIKQCNSFTSELLCSFYHIDTQDTNNLLNPCFRAISPEVCRSARSTQGFQTLFCKDTSYDPFLSSMSPVKLHKSQERLAYNVNRTVKPKTTKQQSIDPKLIQPCLAFYLWILSKEHLNVPQISKMAHSCSSPKTLEARIPPSRCPLTYGTSWHWYFLCQLQGPRRC